MQGVVTIGTGAGVAELEVAAAVCAASAREAAGAVDLLTVATSGGLMAPLSARDLGLALGLADS